MPNFRFSRFGDLMILFTFLMAFLMPYWAFAENPETSGPPTGITKTLLETAAGKAGYDLSGQGQTLSSVIASVLNGIFSILGVVFLAYMIWAGWLWMTASGNDEQVSRAKHMITSAIIGIIVILAAYAITYFIISAVAPGGPANNMTSG